MCIKSTTTPDYNDFVTCRLRYRHPGKLGQRSQNIYRLRRRIHEKLHLQDYKRNNLRLKRTLSKALALSTLDCTPRRIFKIYLNKHCRTWIFNDMQMQSVINNRVSRWQLPSRDCAYRSRAVYVDYIPISLTKFHCELAFPTDRPL